MDPIYESYKQINEVRLGVIEITNLKPTDEEIFKVNQFLQYNDIYSANSAKGYNYILVSSGDLEKAKKVLQTKGYLIK